MILDGRAVAAAREPALRERADAVRSARGRAPTLLLVAFADGSGSAPHVAGKLSACARTGVAVVPLLIPPATDTPAAVRLLDAAIGDAHADAVFIQVPAPSHLDEAALIARIPARLDVDTMSDERADAFMRGDHDLPPVTVTAALLLLRAHSVGLSGERVVIVAEESAFTRMFGEALLREGAGGYSHCAPETMRGLEGADVIVAATGGRRVIGCTDLPAGAIALDIGYYNPGGAGDIDAGDCVARLRALMPVPGGVGPMTVSALIERVIEFAERSLSE